jgi:hypothetical protein
VVGELKGVEPLAWFTDGLERMGSGRMKATEIVRLLHVLGRPSGLRLL